MPKSDLTIEPSLMNAAGILGFTPHRRGPLDRFNLGAFVTNPISWQPRKPAASRCLLEFSGGFLLHTGYPNPGFQQALRRFRMQWGRSPRPVLVHLLAENEIEISQMVESLESVEGVIAIELGFPLQADSARMGRLLQAALGEKPLVARLPLEHAVQLAEVAASFPIAAVSLGPPRGMLPDPHGKLVSGRLYGPAVYPATLAAVQAIAALGIPVIAAGGAYRPEDVEAMLNAGAMGVQLDAVLWRTGWREKKTVA